jgi:hypothetical protein
VGYEYGDTLTEGEENARRREGIGGGERRGERERGERGGRSRGGGVSGPCQSVWICEFIGSL